ncbi:transposase [Sporosarcina newyorkensis]|uniref:transposase n=1 Tax=Sporosarcina newyorkensis TaxID=759851 RepID=UPI0020967818|nr:transposase [Sporosarcina newyorkensis]
MLKSKKVFTSLIIYNNLGEDVEVKISCNITKIEADTILQSSDITPKKTAYRSPWQNAYAERVIGTIKRELVDHVIPLNERHLRGLLTEYIKSYYNTHRTHQGINGKTPIPSPSYLPTSAKDTVLEATPVLNGLFHTYKKAA